MATINKLLIFRGLTNTEQSWRGEVMALDATLQQAKVKRGGNFSSWIANSLNLSVGDQVIAKNKAVISKLPPNVDYLAITI